MNKIQLIGFHKVIGVIRLQGVVRTRTITGGDQISERTTSWRE